MLPANMGCKLADRPATLLMSQPTPSREAPTLVSVTGIYLLLALARTCEPTLTVFVDLLNLESFSYHGENFGLLFLGKLSYPLTR